MTYLVTGGCGLIGARVVRDLVKEGEQVVVYDVLTEGPALRDILAADEIAGIRFVQGDLTDLPLLMHAVKENDVDRIIHMASILNEPADANPPLALKSICEGTLNVFETARILGLAKVVWASTVGVFGILGKDGEPIPNDALHSPWGVYGACKALNESMAAHYCDRFGVDISAIRYTRVYGYGRPGGEKAIVRELMENPAIGMPGRVPFGDEISNWLYVDDAARATILAGKATKTKTRAFNISGDVRSVKEVADYVRTLFPGADITLLPGVSGLSWEFDASRIEEELGFHCQWSIEQGVKEIANATRRHQGLPPI